MTYRNETLPIRAMALKYDKSPSTVAKRLDRGLTIRDALFGYYRVGEKLTVHGVTRRIPDWCKRTNITVFRFYARRRRHPDGPPELWVAPVAARRNRGITAWGRTQSALAWQKETDINACTIGQRLNSGMTPEQALTAPVDKRFATKKRRVIALISLK